MASAAETTYTITVPTGTIGAYEVKQGVAEVPKPPGNGFITKMETDIVDGNGDPVPIARLMLHHIVFINALQPDSTCNSLTLFDNRSTLSGIGLQRFYAAGEERAKLSMPPGYGYPLSTGDRWAMTYMLMNHRSVPDSALIQYKVTVETDPGTTPVKPYWFDVRDCRADPVYNVPGTEKPGSLQTESRDYTIPTAGRIVAGAGHVHGGARNLTLSKPDCGNNQIAESNPTWGLADHPFYNVRPILHEPGPINMSAFQSDTGLPVAAGERIRLNSTYDNSDPHVRVMGIFIVYIAADPGVTQACEAPPGDVQTFSTNQPGRSGPIPFTIPLTGLNAQGEAVTIDKPPGKTKRLKKGRTMPVGDRFFSNPNLRIKRGTSLGWEFRGNELHNLTLANGPVGIASDNLDQARRFTYRFTRPGTYRFFCSLHPVQMAQRVVVKRKKKNKKKGGRKKD
jgi:plastocyanin